MTPGATNLSAFIRAVEEELQLRNTPFDLSSLIAFATTAWPLAREDPDPARWAAAFLEAVTPGSPAPGRATGGRVGRPAG
jgi:hypothetical protein